VVIGDLARALGVFQEHAIERRRLAEVRAAKRRCVFNGPNESKV
jgi:hypothetical protein